MAELQDRDGVGRGRRWPATPFVESGGLDARLDALGADAATRAFAQTFAQQGLAKIDLGEEGRRLCDQAVAQTEGWFADPKVARVQDAWMRAPAVRRLATLPRVLKLLQAVYGRPAFPFQTLNFQRGTQQSTHSDAIHFHSRPERFMCGVWVALEDIRPESGPLRYYPGSHRLTVLTMRGAGVNAPVPSRSDYDRIYIPALQARLDAAGLSEARALPRKGEAVVWAANLAHGGAPMDDPASTRRSLVTHYFFKGCVYHTPMVSDVEGGELDVRLPLNARTGWVEWPNLDGRPVRPRTGAAVAAFLRLLHRRPVTS